MNETQARQLRIGTQVMWDNNKNSLGTVCDITPTAFFVKWDNLEEEWLNYRDAQRVFHAPVQRKPENG